MIDAVHVAEFRRVWWSFFTGRTARWEWRCSCGASALAFWRRPLRRTATEHERQTCQH